MKKKKILIIDDEQGFTEIVKFNLEATGEYEVRVENKGANALNAANDYHPNLILLDVIMPDEEGPDVLYKLRSDPILYNTPIIFLTATIRKDEVTDQEGTIGGHPFLAKPTTVRELIECIEKQLSK